MTDEVINVIAALAILSIFLLVFFCAIKPHMGIASVFYVLTGILIIPFLAYGYQNGTIDTAQLIVGIVMDLAFFLGGVIAFTGYINAKRNNRLDEANKNWQKISHRGGLRRLFRIWRK